MVCVSGWGFRVRDEGPNVSLKSRLATKNIRPLMVRPWQESGPRVTRGIAEGWACSQNGSHTLEEAQARVWAVCPGVEKLHQSRSGVDAGE